MEDKPNEENKSLRGISKITPYWKSFIFVVFTVFSAVGLVVVIDIHGSRSVSIIGSGIDGSPKQHNKLSWNSLITLFIDVTVQQEKSKAELPSTYPVPTNAGIINFMTRDEWRAEESKTLLDEHKKGLQFVIISHTADIGRFETTEECTKGVKTAQEIAFERGFDDISYNYLIGNDGVVYVGRGWSYVPATAKGWNRYSLGIAFIGKYVEGMPSKAALDACKALLQYMVNQEILQPEFTIHTLRQVRPQFPVAPGDELYEEIKTWRANGGVNTWSWVFNFYIQSPALYGDSYI